MSAFNNGRLELKDRGTQFRVDRILSLLKLHGRKMPSQNSKTYSRELKEKINATELEAKFAMTPSSSYNIYRGFKLMG